jgi:hypothetical protein
MLPISKQIKATKRGFIIFSIDGMEDTLRPRRELRHCGIISPPESLAGENDRWP